MSALDRYELGELLGRGGMGEVYRAFDTALNRPVAIKLVTTESADDRARLLREARAAAAITHPNAVVIYDVSPDDAPAFIVMELLHGRTLAGHVGSAEITAETKLRWLRDVASALAAAHARGLVHRDIKPSNVLVCDDGTVKVLDFGIAKRVGMQAVGPTDGAPMFDTAGVAGTPAYMAPEQIAGLIDARSDQYSWAITAHELLAGGRPAAGIGLPADVPPRATAAIARALEDDRTARWSSMVDLIGELDAALGPAPRRPRRWVRRVVVAAIVAAAITTVMWRCRSDPRIVIDPATATCRIGTIVPVVGAPATATIDLATCGGAILVTASAESGGLQAVTELDGPVTLAPPTGRAAGAPGALAVCGDGQLRVVFWRSDPGVSVAAMPFVIGLVKPGDDPCTDPTRFCEHGYQLGPQRACSVVVDAPIATSVVACLPADPNSHAVDFAQIGVGAGVADTELSTTPPARVVGGVTAIDEAVVVAVRDGGSIRVGWFLFDHVVSYATLHTGEVGEPAVVPIGRDALVVWPERMAGSWRLRAATIRARTRGSIAVATGDPLSTSDPPSLVAYAGGIAIAWLDGNGLRLGLGSDLATAIAHATVLATGVRAPKLAAGGDSLVATWLAGRGPELARIECR